MLGAQNSGKTISQIPQVCEIDTLPVAAGYKQIIDKPIHIISNSSSCTDFIYCNNQNIITKYGVAISILDKCHHNIMYGNINICVTLPPIFIREVWDHSKTNTENIKKAISNINWKNGTPPELLNETLSNILPI